MWENFMVCKLNLNKLSLIFLESVGGVKWLGNHILMGAHHLTASLGLNFCLRLSHYIHNFPAHCITLALQGHRWWFQETRKEKLREACELPVHPSPVSCCRFPAMLHLFTTTAPSGL